MVNEGKTIIVLLSHYKPILIGGLEPWNFMTFHILRIVTPTDEVIFFRGVDTTNQFG